MTRDRPGIPVHDAHLKEGRFANLRPQPERDWGRILAGIIYGFIVSGSIGVAAVVFMMIGRAVMP